MITELTPKQIARLDEFAQKWIKIGLSTEPANRPLAEEGIRKAYQLAGLKTPRQIIWLESPFAMCLAPVVGDTVRDTVRNTVWNTVGYTVRNTVWNTVGGQHEVHDLAYFDYMGQVALGINISLCEGLMQVAQNAGWWLPCEEVCYISERMSALHLDDTGKLHNPDGLAVAYPDGFGVYAVHGVQVSQAIIERKFTLADIQNEDNAEIKRVMIDLYGEDQYIQDLGLTPYSQDAYGIFYRLNIGDVEPLCLVRVVCPSTARVYYNQVPPIDRAGKKMERAKQAIAWRFRMTEEQYLPMKES